MPQPDDSPLRTVVVVLQAAPGADSTASPPFNPCGTAPQAERLRLLRDGLQQAGAQRVATLAADGDLAERMEALQPDLVVVDAGGSDPRDALQPVLQASRGVRRPIVLFTDDEGTRHVADAVAAGVCAYIVAGLAPQRMRPIVQVALARFRHEQGLRQQLADARAQLQARKAIERAKGLLMQRQGLSEQAAFDRLRRLAMDKGIKLADAAQRLLDAADLLG